jgi:hypothetical protein
MLARDDAFQEIMKIALLTFSLFLDMQDNVHFKKKKSQILWNEN